MSGRRTIWIVIVAIILVLWLAPLTLEHGALLRYALEEIRICVIFMLLGYLLACYLEGGKNE